MSTRRGTTPVPSREFRRFVGIVRRLRRECPWDRKQTHRSLRESLLEETYEVLETLGSRNRKGLAQELGDLLLHVAMHATIAEEHGEFTFAQVLSGIADKLVRRHPHVYGKVRASNAGDVVENWEQIKMKEGTALGPRRDPATPPRAAAGNAGPAQGFRGRVRLEDVGRSSEESCGRGARGESASHEASHAARRNSVTFFFPS